MHPSPHQDPFEATGKYATDASQQQLIANTGSKRLIVQLAATHHSHVPQTCHSVVRHWIPQAQHDAEAKRSEAEEQLRKCGPRPEELQKELEGTLNGIQAKVLQCNACCNSLCCIICHSFNVLNHTPFSPQSIQLPPTCCIVHPELAKHEP